jgi:hypothetical protein
MEFSPEWFDESSKAWRANKKRVGQSWAYICSKDLCKRNVHGGSGSTMCSKHTSSQDQTSVEVQVAQPKVQGQVVQKVQVQESKKVSRPAKKQETLQRVVRTLRRRTVGSPTEPTDQGVAHRVVRRRREILSQ